jgi:hypothetical protein
MTLAAFLCLLLPLQVAPPPATFEQLVGRVADVRAKRADAVKQHQQSLADLDKAEAAAVAELQGRLKDLLAKLADLGVRPEPPPPPPPPPPPADPLVADLQKLYAADGGANKAQALAALVALYGGAVDAAKSPANDTAEALKSAIANIVKGDKLLTPDAGQRPLDAFRKRLGQELDAGLAGVSGPLTDATRKTVADLYARLSKALEAVKP